MKIISKTITGLLKDCTFLGAPMTYKKLKNQRGLLKSFFKKILLEYSSKSKQQKIYKYKEYFDKWKKHEQYEWLNYALRQIPKFMKLDIGNDKLTISNFRKAVDLYNQLEDIGFLSDLEKCGNELVRCFVKEKHPFYGLKMTYSQVIFGTMFSWIIISLLRTICPYVLQDHKDCWTEENAPESLKKALNLPSIKDENDLRNDILKLINEIKNSKIILSKEGKVLFNSSSNKKIYEILMKGWTTT